MEILLLGPVEVREGGEALALPRRQQRALLAVLALRAGEVVSKDRLIEDLWGEGPPASAAGSLQNAVHALRQLLVPGVLVTHAPGYRLAVPAEAVDANVFQRLLGAARGEEAARRAAVLGDALALWRGPALADVDDAPFLRLEAGRLDELRVTALEERIDAELELGRHETLVGELETLVTAHPFRERLRGQLMLALYRCGRQAEALEVYRAARLALADELGLDPSPRLQELERAILRQDPWLRPPAAPAPGPAPEPAERRLVSVLVALPPAEEDPETLRARLDAVLAGARSVLARHGGELERFGPEGLVAVFGAEAPRDDDALRAVAAAAELGLPAGVATGESVAGAGAVFVRAAELARGDGVQLDERTQALVHAERRLAAPLAGRQDELAWLAAALAEARAEERCRVVTVVGEPGIGKTRLAHELATRAGSELHVLVARCLSHGEGATFLPLLGALREAEPAVSLADETDGALVAQRLEALEGGGEGALGESYWAVRRLLEALGATRPVLLVLDDAHWAGPALLDLVDYLGERAAAPLLVLCLARPELERTLGRSLRLGPLAPAEARSLADGAARLDEETRERIVELAEGNPLYVEQLAAFAAESGEGLPPTLEAVLAGRLGRLDDSERRVLQRASVLGREFTRGGVAALAGQPVEAQLASLARRGLVGPGGAAPPGDDAYRFHHVLLRDAAYAAVTRRDRADLHERAAAWLDRDGRGDDVLAGFHLEQSVACRRELGLEADALAARGGARLADAAMRAWRGNDTAAAVGLLRRATGLLPPGEQRAELLCELALARHVAGEHVGGDGFAAAEEEARRARSARVAARAGFERALAWFRDGTLTATQALAATTAAIDVLAAAGDHRALGRTWLAVAEIHQWALRYEDAAGAARRAAEHYRLAAFSPAACHSVLGVSLVYGPTPVADAAAECSALREQAQDRASEANATAMLGALAGMAGRVGEGRALCDEARALYEEVGNVRAVLANWAATRLVVERRAGALDAAVAIATESARRFEELGERGNSSTWTGRLGELLLASGDHAGAARAVARTREAALAHDVYVQLLWRCTAAKLAAREGHGRRAERLCGEAVQLAAACDAPTLLADLWATRAEVHRAEGRTAEAAAAVESASALLLAKGDAGHLAELRRQFASGAHGARESPVGLSL